MLYRVRLVSFRRVYVTFKHLTGPCVISTVRVCGMSKKSLDNKALYSRNLTSSVEWETVRVVAEVG